MYCVFRIAYPPGEKPQKSLRNTHYAIRPPYAAAGEGSSANA